MDNVSRKSIGLGKVLVLERYIYVVLWEYGYASL